MCLRKETPRLCQSFYTRKDHSMSPHTLLGFLLTIGILILTCDVSRDVSLRLGPKVASVLSLPASLGLILNVTESFTLWWWICRVEFSDESLILLLQLKNCVVQLDLLSLGLHVGPLPVFYTVKEEVGENQLGVLRFSDGLSEVKDVI